MDPNTKLILDELKSVQMNLTNRIVAEETSIGARVGSLEDATKVFDAWKPKMDATMEELRSEVGAIRKTDEKGGSGEVEGSHDHRCYEDEGGGNHHLPKINFPPFDGSNPKLWLGRCLDYFEMYFVPHRRWIKASTMHLSGTAACWLQSVEDQVRVGSWEQFCQLVMNCFGKDQHELLIRHLFHIHQSGSVQEYIDKFIGLVDQLVAYGRNTDPIYYGMRFVDGLRADIRAAMHIQHPNNLDTAYVLALLQEELVDLTRKKELRRPKPFTFARAPVRGPMPLPHPQPRQERPDRPMNPNSGPERRGHGVDDKLSTLRDYRRVHGLCVRCGEKWSRDHRCPKAIQLHAL
ncbi:unnamed protein product [Miscanthus lutarioriparius]|uniref:Retrotransposon gag domain-containing protein n=1 Tax=Miscanthus lutarioriparius TaxID=422564 RepID=A0A811P7C4_9POAL|nr:unnamed protein product [Miscanthus lutarioriparius]